MDDLINATLEYLVDALMIVAGFSGIPDDVLDGIFDDVILAFSLVENFDRRQALGPYGLPEKFFPSSAGALSVDAFFAEKSAMWDTKGYPAAQISTLDGYPYTFGTDLFPGSLAAVIRRGKLYVDYVENVEIIDNRDTRNRLMIQIGDGKSEEAGSVKIMRKVVGVENLINILTVSAN